MLGVIEAILCTLNIIIVAIVMAAFLAHRNLELYSAQWQKWAHTVLPPILVINCILISGLELVEQQWVHAILDGLVALVWSRFYCSRCSNDDDYKPRRKIQTVKVPRRDPMMVGMPA